MSEENEHLSPPIVKPGHGLKENTHPMEQFAQIVQKLEGTFHSLHFTRNMVNGIIEAEIKSAAALYALVDNKKKEDLPFSQIDKGIQSYWLETARLRNEMAQQLQVDIIEPVDAYLLLSKEKIKNMVKGNAKTLKSFQTLATDSQKIEGTCLKEWTKLQNALRKNGNVTKVSKDVRSGQEKCSKAFERLEALTQRMNELEMENHEQSVELVKHFYETVMQQSQRLITHYAYGQKYIASYQRWCDEYDQFTKLTSVPSKEETLWKLVCFPIRHFPKLPCSSEQVKTNMNPNLAFDQLLQQSDDDKTQLSRHLIFPTKPDDEDVDVSSSNVNATSGSGSGSGSGSNKMKKPKDKKKTKCRVDETRNRN